MSEVERATAAFFGDSLEKWRQWGPKYRADMEAQMARALAEVSRLPAEQAAGGTGERGPNAAQWLGIAELFLARVAPHIGDVFWKGEALKLSADLRAALAAPPSEPLAGTRRDRLQDIEDDSCRFVGHSGTYDVPLNDFRWLIAEIRRLRAASAPPETDGGERTDFEGLGEQLLVYSESGECTLAQFGVIEHFVNWIHSRRIVNGWPWWARPSPGARTGETA